MKYKYIKNDFVPEFSRGLIWEDSINGHRVGCLDATNKEDIEALLGDEKATLAIQDPPYNIGILSDML